MCFQAVLSPQTSSVSATLENRALSTLEK